MRISDWSSDVCSSDLLGEGPDVGAGDAAVLDVADDGDVHAVEGATVLAERVAVEQRLGGVLVPTVAGVHDGRIHPAGELPRDARGLVAHHHAVDAHGLDGLGGVAQRLALLHRRRGRSEEHTSELQSLMRISYA